MCHERLGLHRYLVDGGRRMLFAPAPPDEWRANPDGWTAELVDWSEKAAQARPRALQPTSGFRFSGVGTAEGPRFAGCVEVLDWLRGTDWWPDLGGAVLAIETSEEGMSPAGLGDFLRALARHGDLRHLAALLVARPGGVSAETTPVTTA